MPLGFPAPYMRFIRAVQFNRYNDDPQQATKVNEDIGRLNYYREDTAPLLIPRIWNMQLGSRASLDVWGFPSGNSYLPLPPFPIYPGRRGDIRSISKAWGQFSAGQSNDLGYVPATFVGWTPNSGGYG